MTGITRHDTIVIGVPYYITSIEYDGEQATVWGREHGEGESKIMFQSFVFNKELHDLRAENRQLRANIALRPLESGDTGILSRVEVERTDPPDIGVLEITHPKIVEHVPLPTVGVMTNSQREFEDWARVNLARLFDKGYPFLRDCNDIEPESVYQNQLTESFYLCWQACNAMWEAKLADNNPVAMRHAWDGYGYHYIDSGSGSDWATRYPADAEPLYLYPQRKLDEGKIAEVMQLTAVINSDSPAFILCRDEE